MHFLYEMDDPHLNENLHYFARTAVEGPLIANCRIMTDVITVVCAGNTVTSVNVTFRRPFKTGSTPYVVASISSAIGAYTLPVVTAVNPTYIGFTIQAAPSAGQTFTVTYIAVGQTG